MAPLSDIALNSMPIGSIKVERERGSRRERVHGLGTRFRAESQRGSRGPVCTPPFHTHTARTKEQLAWDHLTLRHILLRLLALQPFRTTRESQGASQCSRTRPSDNGERCSERRRVTVTRLSWPATRTVN